jgi:acetoin utilization protein AcuC
MQPVLAYTHELDAYDFGPAHPLRPERAALAVELLAAYDLLGADDSGRTPSFRFLPFEPAERDTLLLVHDAAYLDAVRRASADPDAPVGHGIGPGDTPAFGGMHEASALVTGASCAALHAVRTGAATRAFAPAGGLHHAHRERAAGFCVYNDAAVAIASALAADPDLRIAYVDIDAHHGDGVQEAFYAEPRVLTVSLHEDGRYLYPGTGSYRERGVGPGAGTVLNLPMPPYATPECYLRAFDRVVAPAVRAFAPDILVTQNGADAHWSDPLTTLGMTIPGCETLFGRMIALADETADGRIVALGGGGYSWRSVVPRVWTILGAALLGVTLTDEIPGSWRDRVRSYGAEPPAGLHEDPAPDLPETTRALVLHDTEHVIARLLEG